MKSFSQVTRLDLENEFHINISGVGFLPEIEPIEVPFWLKHVLESRKKNLSTMRTEKAVSEGLIAPVLMAVQERYDDKITLFSGEPLATDDLSGICDFLLTREVGAFEPHNGYFILVEAKKNDLLSGIPQCVAEMYAARILNNNNDIVYGCVSTGLEWIFMKLEGNTATTHPNVFTISEVDKILGVFGWMVK